LPRGQGRTPAGAAAARLRLADLVSALAYALDLVGGQAEGWAVRTCLIGMRLAEVWGLPEGLHAELYYALLLKDAGCSSNAARVAQLFESDDLRAKRESKLLDWDGLSWAGFRTGMRLARAGQSWPRRLRRTLELGRHRRRDAQELIQLRCERGAAIVRKMGFSERTAAAIGGLDERWDGRGAPAGLQGEAIPVLARVLSVAQTLALFPRAAPALAALAPGSGRRYDPELVRAARALRQAPELWDGAGAAAVRQRVLGLAFAGRGEGEALEPGAARLDDICEAFADVIDAKSPFTYRHSRGVAAAAGAIAAQFGLPAAEAGLVRRAALLHDIGKLGVSNRILDKAGPLTAAEWAEVRQHPGHTRCILERVAGWQELAFVASAHHERLDGSGYPQGLGAAELPRTARLLAVADVYDALAGSRPYRAGLPREEVFRILGREAPHALDPDCVAALQACPLG